MIAPMTGTFVARFGLEGYGLHQALWRLFVTDPGIQRDFLYRVIDDAERPAFYVVSARPPVANSRVWRVAAVITSPVYAREIGWRFRCGLTRRSSGQARLGACSVRHDVVMDAHQRGMAPDPTGGPDDQPGLAWVRHLVGPPLDFAWRRHESMVIAATSYTSAVDRPLCLARLISRVY